MKNVIVRSTVGPDHEAVATLARAGVATAHECMGRRGLLGSYLRPIYPGAAIAGRAVTVLAQAGDNLMIHAAVEQCRPGDILVVATVSPSTDGMFGELLATALRARGVIGLVIDAGVRDVAELTKMDFPVWSRAISAQGTVKATGGSVNVSVVIGAQVIRPGDAIVADDDGVLVVPRESVVEVAAAAVRRTEDEAEKRRLFEAGTLTLDIYGLRDTLARVGVTYVDADGNRNGAAVAETTERRGEMTTGQGRPGPDPGARNYDSIPGTVVFDGRRARVGYPLNTMCMSLNEEANREAFRADPETYMARYGLSEEQRQAVRDRDWLRMLDLGGNVYFTLKIASLDGLTTQDVGAAMTDVTPDEFRAMMREGGRNPHG